MRPRQVWKSYSLIEIRSPRRVIVFTTVAFIISIIVFNMFVKSPDVQGCSGKSPHYNLVERRHIDEVCSNDSSYCYSVYDVLVS
ncbi:hypothetical protein GCK32_008364 [Trichostrongylus colubriformis]|uniref:Uncharacterized protein n=1 Tax=Trichostrongylus colubriformis TaxID=6319 RepID=A0AAN8G750_TRICO